ncbi:MAG TPA: sigma-70 family RNA polymerase sigma factor [Pyrinomonadaceae bacterium]|nr:sigma-70 family RNA polymerase sigma factor [Pyrinomonadaceae bacterium]
MLNPQTLQDRREQKQEDREELFAQRYEGLLAWALRLTNHHRASAEDLVQDAFIQFVLGRTSIEEIENVDGYLRRMLRYMHLSRVTRNSVLERTLSIIDYDSFHQGWEALEPSRRLQAREELLKICSYICARKETSRAGIVLILRFFHEYCSSEVASVLGCSPHCVAQWQRLARNELKAHLNGRGRLRLLHAKTPKLVIPKLSALNGDLISELRQMIFRSCQGVCLPAAQLREVYKSGNPESLAPPRLAHIVSCPKCLDVVNRLLDLPLLAERYDSASKDSGEPPHGNNGNGSSGDGPSDIVIKRPKRWREVVEHKPQELRIAVNGTPVSSLKINSDVNELSLNIAEETVEFVEILSEQNIQLLFFIGGDGASLEPDQWATIELSEGRTLEARLQHGKTLRIVYREPVLADAPEPLTLVQQDISSFTVADNNADSGAIHDQWEDGSRSTLGRFWKLLRSRFDRKRDLSELTILGRVSPAASRSLWANPSLITAVTVLAIGTIGAYLLLRTNVAPTLTAALLLEKANQAEEQIARVPNVVIHQVINLEERNSSGVLVARRKIETWENSEGSFVQRLYGENNRMLAGTWQKADGSRTVYHHGSGSRLHGMPVKTDNLLLNLEDVWQMKLSAKEFRTLVSGTEQGRVTEGPSSYIVTHDEAKRIGASRLLKATLTLNRTDLHAIEQTLLIERGNEVREYRFSETSFERLTQKDAPARVFEPDAVLERPVSGRGKDTDVSNIGSAVHYVSTPLSVASAELEVDVAYLLNQAKADRHEQVSLSRTAKGLLQVEGVVDTQQRKDDFLRALSPVSNNPLVKIEIVTVTEALQRQQRRSSPGISTREVEETVNTIAVDRELRNYLSGKTETSGTGADLDEALRSFSSRIVNRAYRVLFHAIELKQLTNRFARVDMRTVTPDARSKWLQMVREHASAFEREAVTLRHELQPLFSSSIDSAQTAQAEISNDADLAHVAERIHKLALENNDAIRSAFTISSQSSSVAIKSPQFWRGLINACALAARLKEYNR